MGTKVTAIARHASVLSPPPENLKAGEKRGAYAVRGDDHPVTDTNGDSGISSDDLAAER